MAVADDSYILTQSGVMRKGKGSERASESRKCDGSLLSSKHVVSLYAADMISSLRRPADSQPATCIADKKGERRWENSPFCALNYG